MVVVISLAIFIKNINLFLRLQVFSLIWNVQSDSLIYNCSEHWEIKFDNEFKNMFANTLEFCEGISK